MADIRSAIVSLQRTQASSFDGWPDLENILQSNPLLSGEADHISRDLLEEAISFVEEATSVYFIESLNKKHRAAILSTLWSEEHKFYENVFVMGHVKNVLSAEGGPLRPIRFLAQSAIEYWNTAADGFAEILKVIAKRSKNQRGWLGAAYENGAFDLNGPEVLATDFIDDNGPQAVFDSWGLRPSLRQSQFVGSAFSNFCDYVEDNASLKNIQKLWDLARIGVEAEKEITFESHRASLAKACLTPWYNQRPAAGVKEFLLEQFRSAYGDPRRNRAHWLQVNPQDEKLFKRWLAGESLELFLDIVGEDAQAHMWDYRRAFWEACFKKDIIDEAWVAFGSSGWRRFQDYKRRDGLKTVRAGKLTGADTTQSVLLMRMGDITLVEWSHNGQIWFLDESFGAQIIPQLYRSEYRASKCRGFGNASIFNRSHNGADGWTWQRETADEIYRYTGVRIQASESMPGKF